jgi:tetratricopeptide (TPR) repeat protein
MTRRQLRQALLIAFGLACACAVVVLAVLAYKLVAGTPSRATTQRLSTALKLSGILGGLSASASFALAGWLAMRNRERPSIPLPPNLRKDDQLVNRTPEMRVLVERLNSAEVVNCHGVRGAGKSYLLGHLTDVVNGHRSPNPNHPKPRQLSAALYFDLADAVGIEQMRREVCRATLGRADGTWDEFVAHVEDTFGRRRVLLVLDNVNTPGMWRPLGEAVHRYTASRKRDTVVLGSIDPVLLTNMPVEPVRVRGLDLEATEEMVATRGIVVSRAKLVDLHDHFNGLPLFVGLLATVDGEMSAGQRTAGAEAAIDDLMARLPPVTRELLAYVALFALVSRQISLSELERCPLAHVETRIEEIEGSLVTRIPPDVRRLVKFHDVLRDSALRTLTDEVSQAALHLCGRTSGQESAEHVALYALFTDPEALGAARFDELLDPVIRAAVKSRNYALVSHIHDRSRENARVLRFVAAEEGRNDLFCYARASELAGLGSYADADATLRASSIVRTRLGRQAPTELQPEMRFLQADIAHLRNRYDQAADMFKELGEWAESVNHASLHARCVWGHAHVLRHQGRHLERALWLFGDAARLADAAGELFPKAYSITGATGIKVWGGVVPDDEERLLEKLEDEIAMTSTHDGYLLEVWKSQAQVAWLRGRERTAVEIVGAAIERALTLNDRLLYNLYFERAEFARFRGDHAAALADYRRVLDFGKSNYDRNLITNALLGIVLLELSTGGWPHHDTREEARVSVLQARETATAADIQITAGIADAVAAMLDDPAAAPQLVRLILM